MSPFIFMTSPLPTFVSYVWCQQLMTSAGCSQRLCTAENLHTCSHDVCTCVRAAIFCLLLIPSRGNVVTPLDSQTPSTANVCSAPTCIYGLEEERNMIYPPQMVRSCVGFLRVPGSISISLTHVWVNVSILSAETETGCGAVALKEFKAFFPSN